MKCTHCKLRFSRGHVAPDPAFESCPLCARPLQAAGDIASLVGFRKFETAEPPPLRAAPTAISPDGFARIDAALADVDAFVAAERARDQLEGFSGPSAAVRARRELLSTPPSNSTNATT